MPLTKDVLTPHEKHRIDQETRSVGERLLRTIVYRSPWLNLYVDKVRFPNGHVVERHHLLDFERQSVVAFVENDEDKVLLVRVYLYTTGSADWELPAGGMEEGESAIEAARREVLEETGHRTVDHEEVYEYYPMNGIANKRVHVIRCREAGRTQGFDIVEIGEVTWFSKTEVSQMIQRSEMVDGHSLIASLLCLEQQTRGHTRDVPAPARSRCCHGGRGENATD